MRKSFRFIRLDGPEFARFMYYVASLSAQLVPGNVYRGYLKHVEEAIQAYPEQEIWGRVRYYNKMVTFFPLHENMMPFRFGASKAGSAYKFDLLAGVRYFAPGMRVEAILGDNCIIPERPTIVKSRPICDANQHAVLLNLNRPRHFYFVQDPYTFHEKKEMLVWRGCAVQQHRKLFLSRFHDHPLCDVGHFHSRHQDVPWRKPMLSVREQLRYKYILALEGNDVASNLKWILSSRSVCMMTKPRYETWFMEGRLEDGRHYIGLQPDFGDLEEKILYYNRHPAEAMSIVDAANQWVAQFQDPRRERLIRILVLWHYFYLSGQTADVPPGSPFDFDTSLS